MRSAAARNVSALEGLTLIAEKGVVEVRDAGPTLRLLGRGSTAPVAAALGLDEPTRVGRAAEAGPSAMLRLGPDEVLVLAAPAQRGAAMAASKVLQGSGTGCFVDVSDRSFGLVLSGARVEDVLASACALNFSAAAFPVGFCTRTLLGKAEVILWRIGPEVFRLEAGRSFAPYVTKLLAHCVAGLP